MRTFAATLFCCLLLTARPSWADGTPASPEALYQQQKKSVALAVTLEVICPIAGMGALYAGDSDRGTGLAILSTTSAGVAVGSLFFLFYLNDQNPSGVGRVFHAIETGSAWTGLVVGGAYYLLTRISGLSLAPDAVGAFNANLQQQLGVPPSEPMVPFRAQATGATLIWRF